MNLTFSDTKEERTRFHWACRKVPFGKKAYVYALKASRTGEIRYVGITNCPINRLRSHRNEGTTLNKRNWQLGISKDDLCIQVLALAGYGEALRIEQALIQHFTAIGKPLLNALGLPRREVGRRTRGNG